MSVCLDFSTDNVWQILSIRAKQMVWEKGVFGDILICLEI